ncbi:uncharacterized protein MELLADRAFT_112413 [Melampsora larici-populina 98AG31]|uniref:Uncharacterized protein n=1 Tax=Melampsora larici-populina (strain 98AG31 / pathotype 3-4-7) TaxID=747676 RepID=F4S6E3_MELLP|nr:uncharacterized protein MELLADRAFT_112413 [Melampsora larici-populina 98AG31]EGF99809.1 hypothetical protein MELLADRAFT_112413 [Melampsora larici-populina 98AG31]
MLKNMVANSSGQEGEKCKGNKTTLVISCFNIGLLKLETVDTNHSGTFKWEDQESDLKANESEGRMKERLEIPGYEFDPEKNRYFKKIKSTSSTQSHSNQKIEIPTKQSVSRTKKPKPHKKRTSSDPYRSTLRLRAHFPISIQSLYESHPGTSLSRFNSHHHHLTLQLQAFQKPITINDFQRVQTPNQFSFQKIVYTKPNELLWISDRFGRTSFTKLDSLSPHWNQLEFIPNAPITSISVDGDRYVLTAMNGQVELGMNGQRSSIFEFTNQNLWSSVLNQQSGVYGDDQHINFIDHHSEEFILRNSYFTGSSVFGLDQLSNDVFLGGTRSGKVLQIDQRLKPIKQNRNSNKSPYCILTKPGSIYHVKSFSDKNQLLVVGSGNYVKIHDLRYLKVNGKESDPLITISNHQNSHDSQLSIPNLINDSYLSLLGDDQIIRTWDFHSNRFDDHGLLPLLKLVKF